MRWLKLLAWSTALLGVVASATDLAYSDRFLEQRRESYAEDIGYNFRQVVLPRLTPSERAQLGNTQLKYPLRVNRSPLFGYYSAYSQNGKEIVMPVESLRFFSDLCSATAWLAAEGYSLSTVYDYLNMLKYGDAAQLRLSRWPTPMQALQIPESGMNDPGVESRRSACFSTGVVFVLAHEMAHLLLEHRGYAGISRAQAQANESAADALAVKIMSRLGDLPLGALYFFSYAAYYEPNRADFSSDREWQAHIDANTHPLSAERIADLGEQLTKYGDRFAAGRTSTLWLSLQLQQIASTLLDPDIHTLQRLQGRSTRPYMLAPRKADIWQVQAPPEPLPDEPFSGYYTGTIGGSSDTIESALVLFRSGKQVHGRYSYAGITGTLKGEVGESGKLSYQFVEPGSSGAGELEDKNGRLIGRWTTRSGLKGSSNLQRR